MSTVTLVGNLTKDFEVKVFESGNMIANGSMAVNERRYNKDTQAWEDGDTSFFNLVVFNGLIENVVDSLGKGARVVVSGKIRVRTYEKKDDAGTGISVEVLVDEIGPSLKWAKAVVTKNPKGTNGKAAKPQSEEEYF